MNPPNAAVPAKLRKMRLKAKMARDGPISMAALEYLKISVKNLDELAHKAVIVALEAERIANEALRISKQASDMANDEQQSKRQKIKSGIEDAWQEMEHIQRLNLHIIKPHMSYDSSGIHISRPRTISGYGSFQRRVALSLSRSHVPGPRSGGASAPTAEASPALPPKPPRIPGARGNGSGEPERPATPAPVTSTDADYERLYEPDRESRADSSYGDDEECLY
ncbi:hypothetical protein [Singapore grouper iridovirus]|nr:hypothetical protein [Singapore grouper iridovirus]